MPNFSFSYKDYKSADELPVIKKKLIVQATAACQNAYAPYSNFRVGCAILLDSGQIINGANVENASFPVGICAERTALSHVITNFPTEKIIAIAVGYVSQNDKEDAVIFPCGLCRQFMLECEDRNQQAIEIILQSPSGKIIVIEKASDLLPFGFTGDAL